MGACTQGQAIDVPDGDVRVHSLIPLEFMFWIFLGANPKSIRAKTYESVYPGPPRSVVVCGGHSVIKPCVGSGHNKISVEVGMRQNQSMDPIIKITVLWNSATSPTTRRTRRLATLALTDETIGGGVRQAPGLCFRSIILHQVTRIHCADNRVCVLMHCWSRWSALSKCACKT